MYFRPVSWFLAAAPSLSIQFPVRAMRFTIYQSISTSNNRSINPYINSRSIDPYLSQWISQSLYQTLDQSISTSNSRSIDPYISQWINQSPQQSIHLYILQTVDPYINHQIYQSIHIQGGQNVQFLRFCSVRSLKMYGFVRLKKNKNYYS